MPAPPLSIPATLELLARHRRDRARLAAEFGSGADRPVARLEPLGDPHQGGRRVTRVRFTGGLTLIHQPRPVATERIWNRTVHWLGARIGDGPLRVPRLVARPDCGWSEDLRVRRPGSLAEAGRWYRRAGALLALFDVAEIRDVHRGNLLAVGDQPVLVDAETIAHPRLRGWARAASLALTGFLPAPDAADDRAGVFAGLPRGAGIDRFTEDLVEGYRAGYRALRAGGRSLLARGGPLGGLDAVAVRVVLRPTASYLAGLSGQAWPPAAPPLPIPRAAWRSVLAAERVALAEGAIPAFHAHGGGTDLLGPDGPLARRCFPVSGVARIADRLGRLSPADLRRQLDLIRGSLAFAGWRGSRGTTTRDRSGRRW